MEFFIKICSVAIGGALGASSRYLIGISPLHNFFGKFPFPTFVTNILGSFLLGFSFILLSERFTVNENLRLGVLVGFLGAFTTFSTFELEFWDLLETERFGLAFTYLFLSISLGLLGLICGIWLAKRI